MDKSSSVGMPMSPQGIFKKYKPQSLVMPKASTLHQQNTRSSFTCYIFIASYIMCSSWSVLGFLFSVFFCFVLFSVINSWITEFLCGRETRSAVLHLFYFGVRH